MPVKHVEKLEELFAALVKKIRRFEDENERLREEVETLKKRIKAAEWGEKEMQGQLENLAVLERFRKKTDGDKAVIRDKVRTMLADLEKIDWV